ncbi:hypothetical protein D6827_00355 [Candidatus Parcubacteria bacterium]|nr:MAG: hypothetical protein D6827_00355 [Candidatus Parcubacteria bacterium]
MKSKNKEKLRPVMLSGSELDEFMVDARAEYDHALEYRRKRESVWQEVDDMYFGNKKKSVVSRANVHIPKTHATVETFIAKIDDPPYISYETIEEGNKPNAEKLNALLHRDMVRGDWEMKDLLAKKEAALYGRTIFKKYSSSENGFTDYLEVIDVLDFLIDPMAGGAFPMKNAKYMGHDNIVRSIYDLKQKEIYDQKAVKELAAKLESDNDADNDYMSRQKRRASLGLSEAVLTTSDSIKLVEWYRYYKGELWYCLFDTKTNTPIRLQKLKDVLGFEEFPFASWAVYPRLFEFWTPGVAELVLEPNKIQNIIISQVLDNNAFRNYGMKAYDANKINDPSELAPRPMGTIGVLGPPRDAIENITFPDITSSIQVYNLIEGITDKEVGVNSTAKGTPNTKRMSATEYAGLVEQTADRFFAANRTFKLALRRLAYLYKLGVIANMTRAQRVKILGADGYEFDEITAADARAEMDIIISSGITERSNKMQEAQRFREYLASARQNPRLNQKFLDEKEAQIAGLSPEEVVRVTTPDMEGDWKILAEAAAENERLVLGKKVEPNRGATTGHIQKHLDYANKTNGLSEKIRLTIIQHAESEIEFAVKNEESRAREIINKKRAILQQQIIPQQPASTLPNSVQSVVKSDIINPEEVRLNAIANSPLAKQQAE